MTLFPLLELLGENMAGKNKAGWRWRFALLQSLGKCLLRSLTYFEVSEKHRDLHLIRRVIPGCRCKVVFKWERTRAGVLWGCGGRGSALRRASWCRESAILPLTAPLDLGSNNTISQHKTLPFAAQTVLFNLFSTILLSTRGVKG